MQVVRREAEFRPGKGIGHGGILREPLHRPASGLIQAHCPHPRPDTGFIDRSRPRLG
jgi:hypothetical protein